MTHRIRVAGLVRHNNNILLVLQQNRHGDRVWSLPGGRLEPTDADIFRGVEREVWEETGLRVEAGDLRFVSEYLAPDMFALTLIIECHLLAGENPAHAHIGNTMEDDNIHDVQWWPLPDILTTDAPRSRIFGEQSFWDTLKKNAPGVLHLGRSSD